MIALNFSPESVFVNIITSLINVYKDKFGKKAEIKVKSKNDSDKSK